MVAHTSPNGSDAGEGAILRLTHIDTSYFRSMDRQTNR